MKTEHVNWGLVAFIDLLGYSAQVLSLTTVEELKSLENKIKYIQEVFEYSSKDDIEEGHSYIDKHVQAFSDCVVINISMDSESTRIAGNFDPILGEVHMLGIAQSMCIHEKTFIRGGIDIGLYYFNNNRFISPAMVNAYRLENRMIEPVIGISDELYEFFRNHPDNSCYGEDESPVSSIFRNGRNSKNEVITFIDYVSIGIDVQDWKTSEEQMIEYRKASSDERNRIMTDGYDSNSIAWLNVHSKAVVEAYTSSENEKVKSKYRWLANYHNEVIHEYGGKYDECIIVLE